MLDYIITKMRDVPECLITRVMHGAQSNTDHTMQRSIVTAKIRPSVRKTGTQSKKLNTALLRCEPKAMELRNYLATKLGTMTDQPLSSAVTTPDISEEWAALSMALYDTSAETLGFMKKRHQDWFDENNAAQVAR